MGDARGISPMRMTGNIAENWQMWRCRFENYLKASEVSKKPQETQCAQLLHYIGKEGFKIYKTFALSESEKDKLLILLEKFEAHFLPKENLSYERYIFFHSEAKVRTVTGTVRGRTNGTSTKMQAGRSTEQSHQVHDNVWSPKQRDEGEAASKRLVDTGRGHTSMQGPGESKDPEQGDGNSRRIGRKSKFNKSAKEIRTETGNGK